MACAAFAGSAPIFEAQQRGYSWDGETNKPPGSRQMETLTARAAIPFSVETFLKGQKLSIKTNFDPARSTCRSIGASQRTEYAATIKSASENVIVNPGEDAVLNCTVDGKPLTPEHVHWERAGYDLAAKTSTAYANGTSQLVLRDARREDVGNFRCIADNRVAGPASRDVLLIVKCRYLQESFRSIRSFLLAVAFHFLCSAGLIVAPEIDKSPAMLRAAAGTGERAQLPCRAQAAPTPTFRWIRSSQELHANETSKYYVTERQLDALTHESVLLIERVGTADYGEYECRAENELGVGSGVGRLDVKSAPEPPTALTVLNVTHDSVTLGWTPGFDGGHRANYRVRYREASSERYRYEDSPPNAHQLTLTGLRSNTHYLFSVMAANVLGASNYLPDLTRANTRGSEATVPPELSEKAELPSFVIFCIALAGLCLLIVNAGLVAWFIMKKRAKDSSNPSSKAATIEMYAPSSYNDTVTGETLSSVSEKSDAYSNDGSQPDFMDETRKKAASTYLVDGGDLPPPRYQQDGTLPHYISNVDGGHAHTRTLPHPRHNPAVQGFEQRSRDDQLLGKPSYVTAPSPGPPFDGSYYNMNSERYLSYPPMDYPGVELATPPLPIIPSLPHAESASETLRRVARTMVPPPDVTHHTQHRTHVHGLPHDAGSLSSSNPSGNLSGSISQAVQSTPKQPQGILKDPKRSNSSASGTSLSFAILPTQHHHPQHQQQVAFSGQSPLLVYQQQQQQQQLDQYHGGPSGLLVTAPHDNASSFSVNNGSSLGNGLLLGAYEPPSSSSLASYNVSLGYTDADGHLV
uniref:Uncharacterized protein n=1 Tax=Anopheles atroparvus TaxID=41427 RepID=A0A182J5W1_ANOAO